MSLKITWIGQGGYILDLGEKRLCIDPYLSNSMARDGKNERLVPIFVEPEDLQVDMIICTHDHIDHLDEATISHTDMEDILYAGPDSCLNHYREIGIPEGNIVPLNREETYNLGEAKVHGVFAKHTEDSIGVIVEYRDEIIYIVGDSLYDEKLLEVKGLRPNILIVCINGRLGNMNFEEAAKLAIGLEVDTAIPSHYGMIVENTEDPNKFFNCLSGTAVEGVELFHGVAYVIAE